MSPCMGSVHRCTSNVFSVVLVFWIEHRQEHCSCMEVHNDTVLKNDIQTLHGMWLRKIP